MRGEDLGERDAVGALGDVLQRRVRNDLVDRLRGGEVSDGEIGAGQPQHRDKDHAEHHRRSRPHGEGRERGCVQVHHREGKPVGASTKKPNIAEWQIAGEAVDHVQPLRQGQEHNEVEQHQLVGVERRQHRHQRDDNGGQRQIANYPTHDGIHPIRHAGADRHTSPPRHAGAYHRHPRLCLPQEGKAWIPAFASMTTGAGTTTCGTMMRGAFYARRVVRPKMPSGRIISTPISIRFGNSSAHELR